MFEARFKIFDFVNDPFMDQGLATSETQKPRRRKIKSQKAAVFEARFTIFDFSHDRFIEQAKAENEKKNVSKDGSI